MKARIFIVLIALTLSIFLPASFNLSPAANGTFLVALNVCDTAGHCLSADSHLASICQYPTILHVFEATSSVDDFKPLSRPFLIAVQKDHPPQV
jgi:hypothetical protein